MARLPADREPSSARSGSDSIVWAMSIPTCLRVRTRCEPRTARGPVAESGCAFAMSVRVFILSQFIPLRFVNQPLLAEDRLVGFDGGHGGLVAVEITRSRTSLHFGEMLAQGLRIVRSKHRNKIFRCGCQISGVAQECVQNLLRRPPG